MKHFAQLLDALVLAPARGAKLRLLVDHFRDTPDPDRGWALAALTGGLDFPAVKPAAIRDLAARARGGDEIARLHDLMALVRDAVDYERGTTHGGTTAAEALALGRGVCQDHAHVFVSAARSLGIPARYVTGYMATGAPGEAAEAAHHAWAEAHVPSLGWIGFDVANRICPDELYVRLACGLDAEQAAPVRGSRRGGGEESLDVSVVAGAPSATQSQQ